MDVLELLDSKIFIKEDSSIDFKSPREYVQPFIDMVSKLSDKFVVETSNRVANMNEDDSKQNVAYGRFKVEAKMPTSFDVQDSESTI